MKKYKLYEGHTVFFELPRGIGQDVAMQVVAVGFIIGVVQDSLETAINSSGDVIYCATAEFSEYKKTGKKIPL